MQIQVECHSGYRADERPLAFRLGGDLRLVKRLVDQWYGPEEQYFRVEADDGDIYILRHSLRDGSDCWTLESFRRGSGARPDPEETSSDG